LTDYRTPATHTAGTHAEHTTYRCPQCYMNSLVYAAAHNQYMCTVPSCGWRGDIGAVDVEVSNELLITRLVHLLTAQRSMMYHHR
jgi:hypothetical protein